MGKFFKEANNSLFIVVIKELNELLDRCNSITRVLDNGRWNQTPEERAIEYEVASMKFTLKSINDNLMKMMRENESNTSEQNSTKKQLTTNPIFKQQEIEKTPDTKPQSMDPYSAFDEKQQQRKIRF